MNCFRIINITDMGGSLRSIGEQLKKMKKILVIIPAFNEENGIIGIVKEVESLGFDYVVINDHSKDQTLDILKRNKIEYLNNPINLGIGGTIQTGYIYAFEKGYEYAVQIDGDGQHKPEYIVEMLNYMKESQCDMVIGSRFITKEGFQSTYLRRKGIKYLSFLIRILTKRHITDPTSGFRLVNRKIMECFMHDYPRDYPEPETAVAVLKKGYKIGDIPVVMLEREYGKSSINFQRSVYYFVKVSLAILFAAWSYREEE